MAAGAVASVGYLRQFFPRISGERRRINLGDPAQFPVDTFTYLERYSMFIYRDHEGVRALSARCTHLGCILENTTDGFECPCHGSCYSLDGKVVSGPATRDLTWFHVGGAADGRIVIDPGRAVGSAEKYMTT
jgi:cytochrome b6-f complex iron-sulfur subunit